MFSGAKKKFDFFHGRSRVMLMPDFLMHLQSSLNFAVTNALSRSTSAAAVRPNPLTARRFSSAKKLARHELHPPLPNDRRPFRLRFRDGRSAAGSVPRPGLHFPVRRTAGRSLELNNYYGTVAHFSV